jgi:hypothetical protein
MIGFRRSSTSRFKWNRSESASETRSTYGKTRTPRLTQADNRAEWQEDVPLPVRDEHARLVPRTARRYGCCFAAQARAPDRCPQCGVATATLRSGKQASLSHKSAAARRT